MLDLILLSKFRKDLKRVIKGGTKKDEIESIIDKLRNKEKLDEKFNNHKLSGVYKGCYDCHIKPDLVLIYRVDETTLFLIRIGSHSELFK